MIFKVKFLSVLLVLLTLYGCKSIEFNEVKKRLVLPSSKQGKIKINYSTKLISKKEFKILSLKIDKIDKEFKSFSIIELPSGKIKKYNELLKPGSYFLEMSVSESLVSRKSIDILTIKFAVNNKITEFEIETHLETDLLTK